MATGGAPETVILFGAHARTEEEQTTVLDFYNPGKSFFLEGEHQPAIDMPTGTIPASTSGN